MPSKTAICCEARPRSLNSITSTGCTSSRPASNRTSIASKTSKAPRSTPGSDPNRLFFPDHAAPTTFRALNSPLPSLLKAIPRLWKIRPSSFSLSGYAEIDLREGFVLLRHQFADDTADPSRLKQEIDQQVQRISEAILTL